MSFTIILTSKTNYVCKNDPREKIKTDTEIDLNTIDFLFLLHQHCASDVKNWTPSRDTFHYNRW